MHSVSAAVLCSILRLDTDQSIFGPLGPMTASRSLLICSVTFSECLLGAGLGSGTQSAKQAEFLSLSHLHNTQMFNYSKASAYLIKCIVDVVVSL